MFVFIFFLQKFFKTFIKRKSWANARKTNAVIPLLLSPGLVDAESDVVLGEDTATVDVESDVDLGVMEDSDVESDVDYLTMVDAELDVVLGVATEDVVLTLVEDVVKILKIHMILNENHMSYQPFEVILECKDFLQQESNVEETKKFLYWILSIDDLLVYNLFFSPIDYYEQMYHYMNQINFYQDDFLECLVRFCKYYFMKKQNLSKIFLELSLS
jgi:hypothetical protein